MRISRHMIVTGSAYKQNGAIIVWGKTDVVTPKARWLFLKLTTRQLEWRVGRNGKVRFLSMIARRNSDIGDSEGRRLVRVAV